jgi:hypothetical protein
MFFIIINYLSKKYLVYSIYLTKGIKSIPNKYGFNTCGIFIPVWFSSRIQQITRVQALSLAYEHIFYFHLYQFLFHI